MAKSRPSDDLKYDPKKGWVDKKTGQRVRKKGEPKPEIKATTPKNAAHKIPKPPKSYKPRPIKNDMDTPMAKALRDAKPDPELTTIKIGEPTAESVKPINYAYNGQRGFYDLKTGKPAPDQVAALEAQSRPESPTNPHVKAPDMAAPAAEAAKPAESVTAHIAEAAAHSEPSAFRRILNGVVRGAPGLVKQAAGYAAFGVVQDQAEKDLKDKTGIAINPNASSFIGGAVPEYLLAAGSKIARLRTALLWGAGSVVLDLLTDNQDAADAAQDATDGSIMPQTQKAADANAKLNAIIQHAEQQRAMAHGVIPDGRGTSLVGVTDKRDKIKDLLNKAEAVKNNALVDRFNAADPTLSGYEYRKAQKIIALNKKAQAKVTAKQMAAQHQARIEAIANKMSGGRMASIRKAYDASAAANAASAVKSKAKGSKKQQARKTGFDNTATPYQHKFMWTDKNGKVYHRKMTLPDLQRRQTQSLDKYRR